MFKKLIAAALAMCMMGSMVACSSSGTNTPSDASNANDSAAVSTGDEALDKTYTLVFSHENAESSFVHQVCLAFKEKVEAATNGHVVIDIYPNGQLGSKNDNWQAMSDNTIQMALGVGSYMDDRFSVLTIPCLFSNVEECYNAYSPDSPLYQELERIGDEDGIKVLAEVPIGFRNLSTNIKTECFEDIAGQDIRVMEMDEYITLWKSFGANPTPVAFSELYLALQQGLVDAQENPLDVIVTNKLYEQQKYVVMTNHEPFYYGLVMTTAAWNELPETYQNSILSVVQEIRTMAYEGGIEAEKAAVQTLKDAGITITEFTEEDHAKMREACQNGVYQLYRERLGDDLFNLALTTAESVKK